MVINSQQITRIEAVFFFEAPKWMSHYLKMSARAPPLAILIINTIKEGNERSAMSSGASPSRHCDWP